MKPVFLCDCIALYYLHFTLWLFAKAVYFAIIYLLGECYEENN